MKRTLRPWRLHDAHAILEVARGSGRSDAQILEIYPATAKADLAAAWKWVGSHTDEIDRDIKANEEL